MPEDPNPYEIEDGTAEYLCLVAEMEERWWNRPGTDKTFVEAVASASDEHFRKAVLVR
jgi:hypothetical protein